MDGGRLEVLRVIAVANLIREMKAAQIMNQMETGRHQSQLLNVELVRPVKAVPSVKTWPVAMRFTKQTSTIACVRRNSPCRFNRSTVSTVREVCAPLEQAEQCSVEVRVKVRVLAYHCSCFTATNRKPTPTVCELADEIIFFSIGTSGLTKVAEVGVPERFSISITASSMEMRVAPSYLGRGW